MAKRYHNSMDVKKQMKKAGSMLSEDMSAPALLPQNVIDRYFPSDGYGMSMGYKDLYDGVSSQIKEDKAGLSRAFSPKRW